MGQTLSEPITEKTTTISYNANYQVASSCMQGWRVHMEDAHTIDLNLNGGQDVFFGVYDGHGGARVAKYAESHVHKVIVKQPEFGRGNVTEAIKKGFLEVDELMQRDDNFTDEVSGTTAVTVLIKDKKLYCGNVGDSRAIACVDGKLVPLSFDHKPNNEGESRRIIAAGGWIEFNRVNGSLALSRALGDFSFKGNKTKNAKEQMVTAFPDVIDHDVTNKYEFIVLACDGIWDVLSSEEVLDFVRHRISEQKPLQQICEELLSRCLAPDCFMGGLGCDNMTVIIVCFLNGGTYEALAARCRSSRAANGNENVVKPSDN
ncbi:putative protein phosphatase 2C T23F11.1 [Trichoplax sp. H2]|nr:putative protein phosphatase 2C T23F11.1 [Trichoplax sp. H2]|eukprot:RDD41057.1 putative protein phosphatase 2C T23F11.1 [Trichoplax sp. H2]